MSRRSHFEAMTPEQLVDLFDKQAAELAKAREGELEQARLLGKGSEREAALLGKITRLIQLIRRARGHLIKGYPLLEQDLDAALEEET